MSNKLTRKERDVVLGIIAEIKRITEKGDGLAYTLLLSEYTIRFREQNGIQAMADYIKWAKAHGRADSILSTIAHDLNGRNDELMYPRTMGYLGANEEHTEKNDVADQGV